MTRLRSLRMHGQQPNNVPLHLDPAGGAAAAAAAAVADAGALHRDALAPLAALTALTELTIGRTMRAPRVVRQALEARVAGIEPHRDGAALLCGLLPLGMRRLRIDAPEPLAADADTIIDAAAGLPELSELDFCARGLPSSCALAGLARLNRLRMRCVAGWPRSITSSPQRWDWGGPGRPPLPSALRSLAIDSGSFTATQDSDRSWLSALTALTSLVTAGGWLACTVGGPQLLLDGIPTVGAAGCEYVAGLSALASPDADPFYGQLRLPPPCPRRPSDPRCSSSGLATLRASVECATARIHVASPGGLGPLPYLAPGDSLGGLRDLKLAGEALSGWRLACAQDDKTPPAPAPLSSLTALTSLALTLGPRHRDQQAELVAVLLSGKLPHLRRLCLHTWRDRDGTGAGSTTGVDSAGLAAVAAAARAAALPPPPVSHLALIYWQEALPGALRAARSLGATLRSLDLTSSDITDADFSQLRGLSRLTYLNVSSCHRLSDVSLSVVAMHMPQLAVLAARCMVRVTDFGVEALAGHGCGEGGGGLRGSLMDLSIGHASSVTDRGARAIAQLTALTRLEMQYCPSLTGEGLKALAGVGGAGAGGAAGGEDGGGEEEGADNDDRPPRGLKRLSRLEVAGCRLAAEDLMHLSPLTCLSLVEF